MSNNGYITPEGEEWYADVNNYNPGFTVGVLGELRLNNHFALRFAPTIHFGQNFWQKQESTTTMHVHYNDNYTKDYEYNSRKREHADEIDRILDKVRTGGYQSLTESEKQTLFDESKR